MTTPRDYATPAPLETRLDLHRRFSVNPEGWHRWVLRRLGLRPGSTMLELGCGTGALWQAADADALRGVELVLCDASPGMLEAARRNLAHLPDARFEPIELDDDFTLPVLPDVLVCNHVLYHVRDATAVLERIRDQAASATRCAFATNGRRNLSELERLLPAAPDGAAFHDLIGSFTLESGYARVRQVFGGARVARYADALSVTDADALAAYVASLPLGLSSRQLGAVRDAVARHIDDHGALYLNKDAGLIEPSSPAPHAAAPPHGHPGPSA